jgi:cbb3-type cytochrome oxidase subunit 3
MLSKEENRIYKIKQKIFYAHTMYYNITAASPYLSSMPSLFFVSFLLACCLSVYNNSSRGRRRQAAADEENGNFMEAKNK